jgi:outer membrane protein OmpA-like peptidoglycan-associated protein
MTRLLNLSKITTTFLAILVLAASAFAQGDNRRTTIAITYPLDQTIEVPFRGTTRLPRLKGDAKVRRQGRRGTRVVLDIDNMPRAYELGGAYTTFVLWAISPDGHVDNLGEIKRSGSMVIDSKIDVTTPLQTFALIVTAEPHFLVQVPSRMVVLENIRPVTTRDAEIETVPVQYIGNTSDYFRDASVPTIAESDYRDIPNALLGARQAVKLARYAGAERDAPNELRAAVADLEAAEGARRMRQTEAEVDSKARNAISSAVKAEEMAITRRIARERREEIQRRDEAVRSAEETAATANQELNRLKRELGNEQHARELAERDSLNATEQLRDARTEIARLRQELQTVRAESEDAKVRLARIEGEKQAEENRRANETRAAQQQAAANTLRQSLNRFGIVRDSNRGMTLVLSESIWANARSSNLLPAAAAKLDQLGALLANNPDFQISIESFTDNRGTEDALQQLTQDRARVLSEKLGAAGVDVTRMQASGLGAANPVAPNTTVASRAKNRRTELTLSVAGQ